MTHYSPGELARMLRGPAKGLYSHEAAVELLIAHGVWLCRDDFVSLFIDVETEHSSGPVAWVDWELLAEALEDNTTPPCSPSEAQVLRIAASIRGVRRVDLREALGGLDRRNLTLVLTALALANGHLDGVSLR